MKKIQAFTLAVLVASIALVASQALAGSSVYFKSPVKARGTGCPGNNSMSVSGENTDTLTVLFDQFDAARPKNNAASGMMRTACSFAIPVHVPAGWQVSTMTADWRGYAEGKTKLHREYFFAGQRGPRADDSPKGDFSLRDNLMHTTWSKCGAGNVIIRINSSVRAASSPSYIAVDTLDLKNKIIFHLKSRKCN
ncbi:MAG: DUF4360 domain-containing protein [Candidatus Electrothrix aestuarii]|jgi:hypothetical protein|uniref:DUF4360 domain-containing protein n=1 Tax=Candidatus Electrothrix aestuarii TaxID=3062594 RepID=A0AAU8LRU9_9BACT|nr:DUF4360 domain-containing protein [Candidatus Electrothrix aestuarii]